MVSSELPPGLGTIWLKLTCPLGLVLISCHDFVSYWVLHHGKNRSANLETDSPFESTVKSITEVTYNKDIIIDIVIEIAIDVGITIAIINVIAFAIVIHIALFEFFCKGEYFHSISIHTSIIFKFF